MTETMPDHLLKWNLRRAELEPVLSVDRAEQWCEERRKLAETAGEFPLPGELTTRLDELKDKYAGKRIFVIGNGPSLNQMDLRLLAGEYTFAANRFYLMYDRIDWTPTFYTATDWRVVPDTFMEINGLAGSLKFFDYRFWGLLNDQSSVAWYGHGGNRDPETRRRRFSYDASRGLVGAGSVVGSSIQLAFHMGFDPIYLIGCDLGYKVPETVIQEGEDVFGNGVKLLLTSTKDDDVNHFDPRYFGDGRKWHDPNVKRMVEGHEACRAAIEAAGRKILNATEGGELEVYPRVAFDSLFPSNPVRGFAGKQPVGSIASLNPRAAADHSLGSIVHEYPRADRAQIEECAIVYSVLDADRNKGVMIDVGAHAGTTLRPFSEAGWTIYGFEPDPKNRERLLRNFGGKENVILSEEAVSDISGQELPFFASDESSGISSLSAFRDSHREVARVTTVTLDEVIARHGLEEIDFLKVDVEGFEMAVLQGLDADKVAPRAMVVEYENDKTKQLGYDAHDLCNWLLARGYVVFVSEWYPIERYGMRHSFKKFQRYPCEIPADSWGNLVGFKTEPSTEILTKAVTAATTTGAPPADSRPAIASRDALSARNRSIAEKVKKAQARASSGPAARAEHEPPTRTAVAATPTPGKPVATEDASSARASIAGGASRARSAGKAHALKSSGASVATGSPGGKERGFLAGFVRTMPIATAAIILAVALVVFAVIVPDGGGKQAFLAAFLPWIFLLVVGGLAYDYFRKRMRERFFHIDQRSAAHTLRLKKQIKQLRTANAPNGRRKSHSGKTRKTGAKQDDAGK
ncbi:MAG: FkbM family methyltransferase [Bauldia litoralis]